jgi:acetylornithine deacetylase/succinyl-diaminopimelate desuccinylase-like protein
MKTLSALAVIALSAAGFAQQLDFNAARDEAARNLSALVKINTTNPPGHEIEAAQWLKQVLDREGIESQVFESGPGRGNIVARLKGNGSAKPLLLLAHLDVVPVEPDKWTKQPFGGMVEDGYLWGRGAADDKGMLAANLEVFLMLHRMKTPLTRDVILLAEAGEEGTPEWGINFMIEKHWELIASEFALNEGGDIEVKDGRVQYVSVATTEKIPRGMKLLAHGSSGHGSMPRLDDPITHLGAAVGKIGSWQPPMRLNETTRTFFARLAKISPPDEAYLYTHLDDPAVQKKIWEKNIQYNSMLRTSISPTILRGGVKNNVIPAEAEAILDVRALPDEDMNAFVQKMKEVINDPAVEVQRVSGNERPPSPPSGLDTAMFRALENAQKKLWPDAVTLPVMPTWATDSAQLRAKGVQCYGIFPPMTDDDRKRFHGNDERLSIEGLGKFVEFIYSAVTQVAAER